MWYGSPTDRVLHDALPTTVAAKISSALLASRAYSFPRPLSAAIEQRLFPHLAHRVDFTLRPRSAEPDIGDLRLLLLDHLVGGGQQRFGDGEAESFGSHLSGI